MAKPEITFRNAKPKDKPYKIFDEGGLFMEIMPSGNRTPKGSKLWRIKYNYQGKEKRLSLGKYPLISLENAREKRDQVKLLLSQGIDPSINRIEEKIAKEISNSNTFEEIAKEWLAKKKLEVAPNTYKDIVNRVEKNLFPKLGKLPIKSITTPIIVSVIKDTEARGALDTVKRLAGYANNIFKHAKYEGKIDSNPASDIIGAFSTKDVEHFKAMPLEIMPKFLRQIDNNEARLYRQTCLALKLMVLTFTRKTELSHAKWSEVDLQNKVWSIPAERMKMRKEHLVPLSRQSIEIFQELKAMNGNWEYVFPSVNKPKQPMHEDTILRAIYRLGYKGIATIHGFRAFALSEIKEKLGYRHEVPDLQLAHEKTNKIDKAYDRAMFIEERTKMMQDWADYIDKLK